ncbi:MAG: phosphatidylinositol diacylglycerol-lyase [Akkermansiaceae bacterium]|nr:phosphatidylinositol diacylglycerol-lyase [Akkermansiaceae bacterium]
MLSLSCCRFLPLLLALTPAASGAGSDWMKTIDGKQPLARLSIPGTHDAGALHEPVAGTTQCQNLTLAAQLEAGVRFLDIRCRHQHDAFAIYHGPVDQKLTFDEVLQTVSAFLKNHPSETVILSAKEEYKAEENTRSFEATFQSYLAKNPAIWHLSAALPALDEVRGKIVLFRRFPSTLTGGIDASVWPDSTTFSSGSLRVQDAYQVTSNDQKWAAITQQLTEAASGSAATLFVNFTSGTTKRLGIPNIPSISDDLNVRLAGYLSAHPAGCCGILVMDFVTPDACARVYGTNFPPGK